MVDVDAPRVKMCGITSAHDMEMVARHGVDAVGLNFYPPSPRYIDPERATEVSNRCPVFTTVVGLFVNPEQEWVDEVLRRVPRISVLQFHGTESRAFCESFGRPYIKAVGVNGERDIVDAADEHPGASALLLDAFDPVRWGGTGMRFDWNAVPEDRRKPLVLAGGLTPENVAEAVARVRPYAVDVCGGVEATRGKKDEAKVEAFMRSIDSVR